MAVANVDKIEVGTPASFGCWTDVYPGVVTKVTSKTVTVREVGHGPNQKVWPDQDFPVYLDKLTSREMIFRRTKDGRYRSANGYRASFGHARYYQDPHF